MLATRCWGDRISTVTFWHGGNAARVAHQAECQPWRNTMEQELAMDAAKDTQEYCTDICVYITNAVTGELYCPRHG